MLLAALVAGCAGDDVPAFDEPVGTLGRNVLVIIADDLGTDKVSAYGEHPDAPPTPNIDALAERGVLFRNAYAHPYGTATRASLMTGRHARRVGLGDITYSSTPFELPLAELTLAELVALSPMLWDTAALGKWNLSGYHSEHAFAHPLYQGFRTHKGAPANIESAMLGDAGPRTYESWEKSIDGALEMTTVYATTDTTNDAIAEIASMESPWLTVVSYNAPHAPVHVPPEHLRPDWLTADSDDIAKYDAAIWAMDQEIGRLFAEMGPDLLAETTVIFMADNGSDGEFVRPPLNEGHAKTTSFEGGINVPMIVAGPWVDHPGSESQALVQDIDLFATVAEIASVDVADLERQDGSANPIDGRSLLPLLRDPSATIRDFAYTERFRPNGPPPYLSAREVVVTRQYKYVVEDAFWAESLFEIEGRTDDGPNLLADPHGLEDEAAAQLEILRSNLQEIRSDTSYAGPGS